MQPISTTSVDDVIRAVFDEKISKTNMHAVGEDLRDIVETDGLGVAILVAWQHGLRIGHIPLTPNENGRPSDIQAEKITDEGCPYVYVRVPVRQFRSDKAELVKRGIMNQKADPVWFIYHEDGLVGTFSFHKAAGISLSRNDIREILDALAQQGILIRAKIDNRQIQFKDSASKRHIEDSGERVYVRVDKPIDRNAIKLPIDFDKPEIWKHLLDTVRFKSACNYCSVQALNPHEATIHSAHVHASAGPRRDVLTTVRNYQLGFTYAPFGDPRDVCHFLAWDFPHINDLVMNMDPQAYSFSDLIKLVRVVNRDVGEFCKRHGAQPHIPISGVCNHWAGNTIYHQHYQFFRLQNIPLLGAGTNREPLARYKRIEVLRFLWPAPAYLIVSESLDEDEDVMFVADRVAREWENLNDGIDKSYGNGIEIKNHTQNTFVTSKDESLRAVFIPRHRRKLGTADVRNAIQKGNAGVLEMMGYFIVDDKRDFSVLQAMSAGDRRALGERWLSEIAPDPKKVAEFEEGLRTCLSDPVISYEKRLEETLDKAQEDARGEIWSLEASVERDKDLNDRQRQYLTRVINEAWRKKYGKYLFKMS